MLYRVCYLLLCSLLIESVGNANEMPLAPSAGTYTPVDYRDGAFLMIQPNGTRAWLRPSQFRALDRRKLIQLAKQFETPERVASLRQKPLHESRAVNQSVKETNRRSDHPLITKLSPPETVTRKHYVTQAQLTLGPAAISAGGDPADSLFSQDELNAAFTQLAEMTGQGTKTGIREVQETVSVSKTVCEMRCVCVNGRWVWRSVPRIYQEQRVVTKQVPYTYQTTCDLAGEASLWPLTNEDTGFAKRTIILKKLEQAAGARASTITDVVNRELAVTGIPLQFDSKALLQTREGDEQNVPMSINLKEVYQLLVKITGAGYLDIEIHLRLRQENSATGTRVANQAELDTRAEEVLRLLVPNLM